MNRPKRIIKAPERYGFESEPPSNSEYSDSKAERERIGDETEGEELKIIQNRLRLTENRIVKYERKASRIIEARGSRRVLIECGRRIEAGTEDLKRLVLDMTSLKLNVEDQIVLESHQYDILDVAEDTLDSIEQFLEYHDGSALSENIDQWSLSNATTFYERVNKKQPTSINLREPKQEPASSNTHPKDQSPRCHDRVPQPLPNLSETESSGSDISSVSTHRQHKTRQHPTQLRNTTRINKEGSRTKIKHETNWSDMFRGLAKPKLPEWHGERSKYEEWRAKFDAFVDGSDAPVEYKMLMLKDALKGDAQRLVHNFNFTKEHYEAAKNKLTRKYGGQRRKMKSLMAELLSFPSIHLTQDLSKLERFTDTLSDVVTFLKSSKSEELSGITALYTAAVQKIPEELIVDYQVYLHNRNIREEGLKELSEFLESRTTFLSEAHEIKAAAVGQKGARTHVSRAGHSLDDNDSGTSPTRDEAQSTASSTRNGRQSNRSVNNRESPVACPVCEENHDVPRCQKWREAGVQDRWQLANTAKICYRCLRPGHIGYRCRVRRAVCGVNGCRRTHHPDLHSDEVSHAETTHNSSAGIACHLAPVSVALRTITVKLVGPNGRQLLVNAFLDDGSDTTYVKQDVAEILGCRLQRSTRMTIDTLIGSYCCSSYRVDIDVENLEGTLRRTLTGVKTLPTICSKLVTVDWNRHGDGWPHLQGIDFHRPPPGRTTIDILIGSDFPELSMSCEQDRIGKPGEPIARRTPLGWTCVGRICDQSSCNFSISCVTTVGRCDENEVGLDSTLQRMWEIDSLGVRHTPTDGYSPDEKLALEKAEATRKYIGDRYEIGIPWVGTNTPEIRIDNRSKALSRLLSLEKFLARSDMSAAYNAIIQDNIDKGYYVACSDEELQSPGWYTPHFPVIREEKSRKIRPVIDSADRFRAIALNDLMLPGPKLQNDISRILIRFRANPVTITADIREMFPQIVLRVEDRRFHRLLWRPTVNEPIRVYQAARLPFGDRSSPFLAQYVVLKHAEAHRVNFPLGAAVCTEDIYVDDVIHATDSVETAIATRREVTSLLRSAGFEIRRWASNKLAVVRDIPEADRADGISIEEGILPCAKMLGVLYNATADQFGYEKLPSVVISTKRDLLSRIASIFDPLQVLAPIVIVGRMLLQSLWVTGIGWYESIPPGQKREADKWCRETDQISKVILPRFQFPELDAKPDKVEIHTFVDASRDAYAAVTYLRYSLPDGHWSTSFVAAKAFVAPLKSNSIPRLELAAAIIGLRLSKYVGETLHIDICSHTFWTDSTDVLYWIFRQSKRNTPFVAHRIGEIHEHTLPKQWRHVPTSLNPADLPTRGQTVEEFLSGIWLRGPSFLRDSNIENWPARKVGTESPLTLSKEAEKETRNEGRNANTTAATSTQVEPLIDAKKFSSFARLLGSTAYVLRAVTKWKPKALEAAKNNGNGEKTPPFKPKITRVPASEFNPPTVSERRTAERYWLKEAQSIFCDQINKIRRNQTLSENDPLSKITPFLDSDGLLRVRGRIQYSKLPMDAKHPIILPRRHPVSSLIIHHYHVMGNHVRGTNGTLADLRQRFWIIHAREAIKDVERTCSRCKLDRRRVATQQMAPLPVFRVESDRAFGSVGVDFAGPFSVKITRRVSAKRYICLFTCCTCRAVHLEVAYSMDTDSCMGAFSRFVARRGKPDTVISDNGSNLAATEKELRLLVENIDGTRVIAENARQGIEWKFSPPYGPHHGGVYERMIKACKRSLYAILGDRKLTDEELLTAVVETEGFMNSRPLQYVSDNPDDDTVLTPNNFLYGRCYDTLAPSEMDRIPWNPRNRWRYVNDLIGQAWTRFLKEYLTGQQARKKWTVERPDLEIGAVVLVGGLETTKGRWPLGRVTDVHRSRDGHIRSVTVRCGGKNYVRPIVKVAPLEA